VALIAEIFHAKTSGPVAGMIAIVIAAFSFSLSANGSNRGWIAFFIATGWITAAR